MPHLSSFMFPGEGIQFPVSGQFSTPRSTSYRKEKKKHKHSYLSQILPQDHSSLYRDHFEEAEIISITNYSKNIY